MRALDTKRTETRAGTRDHRTVTGAHSLLSLQRLAGNAAVSRLIAGRSSRSSTTGGARSVPALQRNVGRLLQRSVEQEGAPGRRPNLDVGDSGPGVALLQQMLGATQTGSFDQQTRSAVDRFQRQQGWEPSGVGPQTWQRLDGHAGAPGHRPNLVERDRGPGVRLLQRMLGVTETGLFGSATRKAADAFQRGQGWEPSGVGPMTWAALDRGTDTKAGPAGMPNDVGSGLTGALVVGGKLLGDVSRFEAGGTLALRGADAVAKGVRATIGASEIASDAVVAVQVGGTGGGAGAAGVGLVPVIGVAVLGAAAGAGIALSPIAVAHAQDVADQLGEFGGNLPPGGAPCPQCRSVRRGTTPDYGALDDFLRPRGITALLKGRPDAGTPANHAIEPPGWTGGGTDRANQARTHLLGQALGGSGSEARNLVTFDQGANVRMFNEFERDTIAITSTSEAATCFRYTVTPEYLGIPKSPTDRSALMPHRITATLVDLCTGETLINRRFVDNLLPH